MELNSATNNLDALAQKLYDEIIEKSKAEAEKIVVNAQNQAEAYIKNAEAQSFEMLKLAEVNAKKLKDTAEMEMQLAAKRFLHNLKDKIASLFVAELLEQQKNSIDQPSQLLHDVVSEIIKKWRPDELVEIQLSRSLQEKLTQDLGHFITNYEGKFVLHENAANEEEVVIIKSTKGFELQFSDRGFEEFLKPYFSSTVKSILFTTDG